MTSFQYTHSRGRLYAASATATRMFCSADDGESSSSDEEDFNTPAISSIRSLPPNLRRLLRSPSLSQLPSCSPTPQRQRPRLWAQSPSPPAAAASAASSKASNNSSKRRIYSNDYESDNEDDSSSDEEEFFAPRGRRPAKKARRSYSPLSTTLRGTPSWLAPRENAVVAFSSPLVTEVRTRPRTSAEDKSTLFYSKADEKKFRADYQRERRLGLAGDRESDEDSRSSGDDEIVPPSSSDAATEKDANTKDANTTRTKDASMSGEEIHPVTESSSSNDEGESDESSSSSSQSDDDENRC